MGAVLLRDATALSQFGAVAPAAVGRLDSHLVGQGTHLAR
jgi:hypothetical protein